MCCKCNLEFVQIEYALHFSSVSCLSNKRSYKDRKETMFKAKSRVHLSAHLWSYLMKHPRPPRFLWMWFRHAFYVLSRMECDIQQCVIRGSETISIGSRIQQVNIQLDWITLTFAWRCLKDTNWPSQGNIKIAKPYHTRWSILCLSSDTHMYNTTLFVYFECARMIEAERLNTKHVRPQTNNRQRRSDSIASFIQ